MRRLKFTQATLPRRTTSTTINVYNKFKVNVYLIKFDLGNTTPFALEWRCYNRFCLPVFLTTGFVFLYVLTTGLVFLYIFNDPHALRKEPLQHDYNMS